MTASDNYWPAVVGNLQEAQKIWYRLSRILGREGSSPMVLGVFFEAYVQAVLHFGVETWVMTPRIGRALVVFQHIVS